MSVNRVVYIFSMLVPLSYNMYICQSLSTFNFHPILYDIPFQKILNEYTMSISDALKALAFDAVYTFSGETTRHTQKHTPFECVKKRERQDAGRPT